MNPRAKKFLLLTLALLALKDLTLFACLRVADFFRVGGSCFLEIGDETRLGEDVGFDREKTIESGFHALAHQAGDFRLLGSPAGAP